MKGWMKTGKILIGLLLVAISLNLSSCGGGGNDDAVGIVAGKITDSLTDAGIQSANITIGSKTGITDSNGVYSVSNVPKGNHTITISQLGYKKYEGVVDVKKDTTVPYDAKIVSGLIAHYSFNGNTKDKSGNDNHGTANGAFLTADRFGNEDSAYSFDGADDYIEIIPQSNVSNVGDFTVSAWTYLEDWKAQTRTLDRQYIFDGHSHSNTVSSDFFRDGFGLIYDGNLNTEEIHNFIYYPNNSFLEQNTPKSVKGKWHYIVLIRENKNDYTYFDGQLVTTSYFRNVKKDDFLNMNHKWFIGTFSGNNPSYDNGFNYSFNGIIDDVRIYNRVLTGEEIQSFYHKGGWTGN